MTSRVVFPLLSIFLLGPRASLAAEPSKLTDVHFEKIVLADKYYCDGINVGDLNGDEHLDVVAGPFWYEGPDFQLRHEFYQAVALPPEESPSNSLFSFVHDFNHDGRNDILVVGRVHKHPAMWYENLGHKDQLWTPHFVFERIRGETPALVDLDGDGVPQLICHWDGRWGTVRPQTGAPTKPWEFHPIGADEGWPQFYHGQGVGDVNRDGRLDLIINDGWYEQPAPPHQGEWTFHRGKFSQGRGGAQMFADDVDGDGDQDVISAIDAHGWGLAWYEQQLVGDQTRFREHRMMGDRSMEATFGVAFTQPHALDMADIDNDGHQDILVGKRMWAHGPEGDIEPGAAPVVYWFQHARDQAGNVRYIPHLIDDHSGVGLQIRGVDVNADGKTDVLTASKLGTFLFLNRGR